jgi:hypothetical protein
MSMHSRLSEPLGEPPPANKMSKQEARRRLFELCDEVAARVAHIPIEEIDAVIDEAIAYVRRHPERESS